MSALRPQRPAFEPFARGLRIYGRLVLLLSLASCGTVVGNGVTNEPSPNGGQVPVGQPAPGPSSPSEPSTTPGGSYPPILSNTSPRQPSQPAPGRTNDANASTDSTHGPNGASPTQPLPSERSEARRPAPSTPERVPPEAPMPSAPQHGAPEDGTPAAPAAPNSGDHTASGSHEPSETPPQAPQGSEPDSPQASPMGRQGAPRPGCVQHKDGTVTCTPVTQPGETPPPTPNGQNARQSSSGTTGPSTGDQGQSSPLNPGTKPGKPAQRMDRPGSTVTPSDPKGSAKGRPCLDPVTWAALAPWLAKVMAPCETPPLDIDGAPLAGP